MGNSVVTIITRTTNPLMPPTEINRMTTPRPNSILNPPHKGPPIYYRGPDLSEGPKPTVLFFALSAHSSLYEDPFNQPVLAWIDQGIRVFSWDLPHHGPGLNHHEAMHHWAEDFSHNPLFVADFIDICIHHVQYLIDQGHVEPDSLTVAGLSRGGFIATHLAAQDNRIATVLGFAPMTQAPHVEEFQHIAPANQEAVSLIHLVDRLTHTRLRFYIGNHDKRVSTNACYAFIHALTEKVYTSGVRSPAVELIIYPSIGFKGHGTPPAIFQAGAEWLKAQLNNL